MRSVDAEQDKLKAEWRRPHALVTYRVSYLLVDLGWVAFNLGVHCSPILPSCRLPSHLCQIPIGIGRIGADNKTIKMKVYEQMGHPVHYLVFHLILYE